jgi:hypothetical protein
MLSKRAILASQTTRRVARLAQIPRRVRNPSSLLLDPRQMWAMGRLVFANIRNSLYGNFSRPAEESLDFLTPQALTQHKYKAQFDGTKRAVAITPLAEAICYLPMLKTLARWR